MVLSNTSDHATPLHFMHPRPDKPNYFVIDPEHFGKGTSDALVERTQHTPAF